MSEKDVGISVLDGIELCFTWSKLHSTGALNELDALGALNALGALDALGTLNALGALDALGTLHALGALDALGVLGATTLVEIFWSILWSMRSMRLRR